MFNGDFLAARKAMDIIVQHGIRAVVETGTYEGETTRWFAEIFDGPIFTIECDPNRFEHAREMFQNASNVVVLQGNSPEVLDRLLPHVEKPLFAFLDAHWNDYWPLLDELETFSQHRTEPVLMIHDVYVPGMPFGYDTYKGQKLDWEYVKDKIGRIYNSGFDREYNCQAAGSQRGILYVYPRQRSPRVRRGRERLLRFQRPRGAAT
jgi:hypothetical protein